MSDQSNFKDEEIREHLRQSQSRRKNVDSEEMQAKRDLISAAHSDTSEEFQARVQEYGVDLNSQRGRTIMEAYWATRRGLRR
jgi:hypothetical protein